MLRLNESVFTVLLAHTTHRSFSFYISSTAKLVLDEAIGSIHVEDENLAVLNPAIGLDSDFDGGDGFDYSL